MSQMTFKDYIESLPETKTTERRAFINQIATQCAVHYSTVYRWISGKSQPDKLKQEKIAAITGLSITELFQN